MHKLGIFRYPNLTRDFRGLSLLVRVALTMERWPDDKQIALIDEYLDAGFSVLPNLKTRVGAGRAPEDMDRETSLSIATNFGYSAEYQDWCLKISERWGDAIQTVLIENEPNSPHDWAGTVDEYIRLCITAKTVFPKVADGGLQPKALFWCIHPMGSEYEMFVGKNRVSEDTIDEQRDKAWSDSATRRCDELLRAKYYQWVDCVNFHYAHGFPWLRKHLSYLRSLGKPILCSSIGCARPYAELSGPEELERRVRKCFELGCELVVVMSVNPEDNEGRLITAMDNKRNVKVMQRLCEEINN